MVVAMMMVVVTKQGVIYSTNDTPTMVMVVVVVAIFNDNSGRHIGWRHNGLNNWRRIIDRLYWILSRILCRIYGRRWIDRSDICGRSRRVVRIHSLQSGITVTMVQNKSWFSNEESVDWMTVIYDWNEMHFYQPIGDWIAMQSNDSLIDWFNWSAIQLR